MRCKKTKRTQVGHLVEALNFLVKCSVLWRKEYLVQLFSRYSAYYPLKRLKKKKNLVLIVKHLNKIKISVINAPFLFTVSAGER